MADTTYVRGNDVLNATSYELFEKTGETYNSLATAEHIDFEVSAMAFDPGNHTLVVKAKADAGYEDSDYSNEVVYTVAAAPADDLAGTWLMNETIDVTSFGGKKGTDMGVSGMNLYKGYNVSYTAGTQQSDYLLTHTSAAGILAYCIPGSSSAGFLYNEGKWSKADYKNITITSKLAEVEGGETLLAWFNANGTKLS